MNTLQTKELLEHMFDSLDSPSKPLTKWEADFTESVLDQYQRFGKLTERQFEILERIYAEKTA